MCGTMETWSMTSKKRKSVFFRRSCKPGLKLNQAQPRPGPLLRVSSGSGLSFGKSVVPPTNQPPTNHHMPKAPCYTVSNFFTGDLIAVPRPA